MKNFGWILALLSACSASVDSNSGGDDMPGDGDVGVGNDDIRFRLTSIADERADQIDFASGAPVHTHVGPRVQLGGADCPDVYKHSYLMDTKAPVFGREAEPNALAWTIEAKDAAEYRVRTGDDTTLQDWTAVTGTEIELHRDVVKSGKHLLDVRVADSVATTCFIFHPLAAPLEAPPPAPDTSGLAGMTFAQASPISRLFNNIQVPVFEQRFVHHTNESLELAIDVTKPAASYVRHAVDEYVTGMTLTTAVICEDANGSTGAPLCVDTSAIPAGTSEDASGTIAGTWSLTIIDAATNQPATNCTITGLRATCRLAARTATAAAQQYRIVLSVANLPELAPFAAGGVETMEVALVGHTFTGRTLDTLRRCAEFKEVTKFGVTVVSCIKETNYPRIQAMDTVKVAFEPVAFAFATTPDAGLAARPLAPQATAAFTWDAGDADLPGPH